MDLDLYQYPWMDHLLYRVAEDQSKITETDKLEYDDSQSGLGLTLHAREKKCGLPRIPKVTMSPREHCQKFFSRHGMDWQEMDVNALISRFQQQMDAGLAGKESSLAMIPTWIEPDMEIPVGKKVIVLDAGGTNLRICTVEFSENGEPEISNFAKYRMPGFDREITAEEFYGTICDHMGPVLDASDEIGFCFSYPTEITPDKDGKLLYWTKEIKVPQVEGTYLGAGLNAQFKARGHPEKKIIVLNDTVAALLAGKARGEALKASSYMGYILGTGSNMAYVENNTAISKLPVMVGKQVINMESGNFSGMPWSDIDEAYDATSSHPGMYHLEKAISGAYLGPLSLEMLKVAHAEGLIHEMPLSQLCTRDVNKYLRNPHAPKPDPKNPDRPNPLLRFKLEDQEMVYTLLQMMIGRGAFFTAINIAAPILKSDAGRSPLAPVCINLDGSTIHKVFGFKSCVVAHLYNILVQKGIHYRFFTIDNAPVVGAAIAGLTN